MSSFSMHFRAIRNIKKDEEITTDYCGLTGPASSRAETLAPYGFKCSCRSCLNPTVSEPIRLRTLVVDQQESLENGWNKSFQIPTSLADQPLLDNLTLFEREGLEVRRGYGYTLFALMKVYIGKADFEKAKCYAGRYNAWVLARTGTVPKSKGVEKTFFLIETAEMVYKMKELGVNNREAKAEVNIGNEN